MKVSLLIGLARQVEGEFVFLNILKCNKSEQALRDYLTSHDLPRSSVVDGINCVVEYGVIPDVEVDEN